MQNIEDFKNAVLAKFPDARCGISHGMDGPKYSDVLDIVCGGIPSFVPEPDDKFTWVVVDHYHREWWGVILNELPHRQVEIGFGIVPASMDFRYGNFQEAVDKVTDILEHPEKY